MSLRHLPAHLLSLARIPLAAVVWLAPEDRLFFLLVLAAGGLTDVLDGLAARLLDKRASADPANPGAWLDPLCDKIFAASCVVAAFVTYAPPAWIVASLLAREILQAPVLLAWLVASLLGRTKGRGRVDFHAVPIGKATTVLQTLALVAVLFLPAALPFLAPLVAALGAASVFVVVRRALRALRAPAVA
jgi:cardiolipin synthase (CMP-forming)